MIKLTSNAKDVATWVSHLKTNILRSQTKLAKRVTETAYARVVASAPAWRGTLKGMVAMHVFPKNHRGEVFMSSELSNTIALENEYNIGGRRILFKGDPLSPLIGDWASEKGLFLDKPFVVVGQQPNTHLGKLEYNKFFYPAFLQTQRAIPDIASVVVAEAVMKTKG